MALTSDNYTLTRVINENISRLGEGISELQIEQKTLATCTKQREIRDWLSSPDPSSNHNAACKTHQKDTGNWLLESKIFEEWKAQSNSFLWLHGIPGCGKSVLCLTVIENIKSRYNSNRGVAVAYYYFSFTDSEKQKNDKFVRSLIEQFAWQYTEALNFLEALYAKCENGRQQPTADLLESTLKNIIGVCQETFIIVDALDECNPREDLLTLLETLPSWTTNKLHILVTSRKERDIEQVLDPVATKEISLQGPEVENDIQSYITYRLQGSTRLRRWPAKVRGEIEKTLSDKAKGMFRWVVCQMDVLEKCVTVAHLRKALVCLPETLDDTYDRILRSIDKDEIYRRDAFRLFQWLAYSLRPLSLMELAEIIAIDTEECTFDPENRLTDPRDLLTICSGLVTTVSVSTVNEDDRIPLPDFLEIRLAHFSVKEYLISERIRTRPGFQYDIRLTADIEITRTCLIYLLYFQEGILTNHNLATFPLAVYASKSWTEHFKLSETSEDFEESEITELALQLCEGDAFPSSIMLCEEDAFPSSIMLFDPEGPDDIPDMNRSVDSIPPSLYYLSLKGLYVVVAALLDRGADANSRGGNYGNSLQAASINGHISIVSLLLDHNAEINALGGHHSTALVAASTFGDKDIVALLLSRGADSNLVASYKRSALNVACENGYQDIVAMLLDHGVDLNYLSPSGSALCVASFNGYIGIVSLLLEKGADPNIFETDKYSPLYAACHYGRRDIVALLLDHGADVDPLGPIRSALCTASGNGHEEIVTLLLEQGADVNATCGVLHNRPLLEAVREGRIEVVALLLERGADVNASPKEGTALYAACWKGDLDMVALLLNHGADVNGSGLRGSAFSIARSWSYNSIVALLRERGAQEESDPVLVD